MSNIFDMAIECMNAAYEVDQEAALENSDVLSQIDELVMTFRNKHKIPKNTEIGNADQWEDDYDAFRKEADELEVKVFNICWGYMMELMIGTGLGEIAGEVLMSELTGLETSWDKKARLEREAKKK